jgi:hypothetical protein
MIEPRSEGTPAASFAVVRAAGREPLAPALARCPRLLSIRTAARAVVPCPGTDRGPHHTPASATAFPRRFS